jgi:hypothetical protein
LRCIPHSGSLALKLTRANALFGAGRRLRDPIAAVARLHDVATVRKPLQQRRGHLGIHEYAGVLIQLAEQVKQQRTNGFTLKNIGVPASISTPEMMTMSILILFVKSTPASANR